MIKKVRDWNRKNISNYLEIYLKTNIKSIISNKYKKIYSKTTNLVGLKIKAEFPKKPDILIYNDFKETTTSIANRLVKLIRKKIS